MRRRIAGSERGARIDQWLCLTWGAVPDGNLVQSFDEIGGHSRTHVSQADKTNFHRDSEKKLRICDRDQQCAQETAKIPPFDVRYTA